jgi:uncharacterized protein YkwD
MRSVAAILCGLVAVLTPLFALTPASLARARHHRDHALMRAVNAARAQHRVPPVRWSRSLARAARHHSGTMARTGVFSHGAFASRLARFTRAAAIGENLAWLSQCRRGSARVVVGMWLDSPGHRQVLLSRSYRRVGIGVRVGRLTGRPACLVTADFSS